MKLSEETPKPRGFALLTPERRKEIARAGGSAVPAHKRAFSQDSDLASAAGTKGGLASHGGGRPKKVVDNG
jgi:general stress protein YciG